MRFPDIFILIPVLLLVILGIVVTFSVSSDAIASQIIVIILGLCLFIFISQIDFAILTALSLPLFIGSIFLLLLTLLIGQEIRGSRRWLFIGSNGLQTSELLKPFLILGISFISNRLNVRYFPHYLFVLIILVLTAGLVFLQPDLGSMIVVLVTGFFVILAAYPKKRFVLAILLFFIISLPIVWHGLADYQKARIDTFLHPNKDPLGASYNQIQAVIAVGSGQLLGKGLGGGTQSRLQFLPEKHTDFFFATLAEELGFMGVVTIVILYFLLSARLLYLFSIAHKPVLRMVFLGVFALFFFQAMIHIGINVGILPVTGITLPFLSVGGSSMLASWLTLGIASSASCTIKNDRAIFLR